MLVCICTRKCVGVKEIKLKRICMLACVNIFCKSQGTKCKKENVQ